MIIIAYLKIHDIINLITNKNGANMNLSKLAILAATAIPAVLAYKKYNQNSEHYNKKFNDIKDSLYNSTCADLKVTREQKDEIKNVLKTHKDAVTEEIKEILKPKQKDVVDKATS